MTRRTFAETRRRRRTRRGRTDPQPTPSRPLWPALLLVALLALPGCNAIPGMRPGSRCAETAGTGPTNATDFTGVIEAPGFAGLTPEEAFEAAAAAGIVVVFRQDDQSCVCVPPPGFGPITEGFWGSRGQLYLDLFGVTPQGQKLPDGAGCA